MSEPEVRSLTTHSRLVCPYCSAPSSPNSLYCMTCGQIVSPPPETLGVRADLMPKDAASSAASLSGQQGPAMQSAPQPMLPGQSASQPPVAEPMPWQTPDAAPAHASEAARSSEAAQPFAAAQPLPAAPSPAAAQAAPQAPQPQQPPHVHPATSVPAATASPASAAAESAPELPPTGLYARTHGSAVLTFANGQEVRIARGAIIGRQPEATARNAGLEPIEIDDDAMSLSRAHARIDVTARTVRITDLGSSNGTEIERSGETHFLDPDQPVSLRPGDIVWLGSLRAEVSIDLHAERSDRGETTGH